MDAITHENGEISPLNEKREVLANQTSNLTKTVAFTAIMTALVTVTTITVVIAIPQTSGYFNIGEAIIYIAAILFGPFVGAFAGGIGAAFADVFLGFAEFAPVTLVVKGIEGFLVGFLYKKLKTLDKTKLRWVSKIIASIAGGLCMVAGYFLAEYFIFAYGFAALAEIPFNLLQLAAGIVLSFPVAATLEQTNIIK